MKLSAREKTGILLSPLIIPLIGVVTGGFAIEGAWGQFGVLSAAIFSYLGMIVLGLPSILFLKNRGKLIMGWVLAAGMLGGVLVWLLFMTLLSWLLESTYAVSPISIVAGAILGAFVAFIYALIAGVKIRGQAI